jgi:ATP-dependent Clp protease ATP-binding subunit ClpA
MSIPLIRFDMSEYMEEHSVSKLIGSPPGYKDSGDGKAGNGLLINAIDENPHCVLLLDEIEKANSRIHNLLLQVMDNGKLTSSMGKQVSFENVFLVMTSNAGSYNAEKHSIGFGNEESLYDKDLEQTFLPEFRNRIDKIINFNNLTRDVMKQVCEKFLRELGDMLEQKNIEYKYDDSIVNYIVDKAYNKNNGAREMKHIITNEIKNVIAKKIVFGEYKENNKIVLRYNNGVTFDE